MNPALFTAEERAAFSLRALYAEHGFLPYRMSKFEEYDLYAKNKDFLVSPQVITFTDTDGKLLALKPDVTLSIVKNFDGKSPLQKVYYNETVYRPAQSGGFREILQSGVECMGEVTESVVQEVLTLAKESLAALSERFVLSVSDLGLSDGLFQELNLSEEAEQALVKCIRSKNAEEAVRLCRENGGEERVIKALSACIFASQTLSSAVETLAPFALNDTMKEALFALSALAKGASDSVVFDFSVLPNRRFYNGAVFLGYLPGVPSAVLSGGSYDKLMRRMKKDGSAIGFALYLDRLSEKIGEGV